MAKSRETKQDILNKIYDTMDLFDYKKEHECLKAIKKLGQSAINKIPMEYRTEQIEEKILSMKPSYLFEMRNKPTNKQIEIALNKNNDLIEKALELGLIDDEVRRSMVFTCDDEAFKKLGELDLLEDDYSIISHIRYRSYSWEYEELFDAVKVLTRSLEVQKAFIEKSAKLILKFENPPDELLICAVNKYGSIIQHFQNAPLEIKIIAINECRNAYQLIKDKTEELLYAHLRRWGCCNLEGIKLTNKLKKYIIESQPDAIEYEVMQPISEEMYRRAFRLKPRLIRDHAKNVSPELAADAIGNNVDIFKETFEWFMPKEIAFPLLVECLKRDHNMIKHFRKHNLVDFKKDQLFQILLLI